MIPIRQYLLAFLAVALVGTAHGQTAYPTKPIRIIIPSTPGGGTDTIGRLMSDKLAAMNGWQVVPENKPGAGTTLGLAELARSSNTGEILAIGLTDNMTAAPLLNKLTYDPVKDLTPVALIATTPLVLVVPENSPLKTLEDLIRVSKASPGSVTYGSAGVGGSAHLVMEMLQAAANFKMEHVPYKGSTAALPDLVGGRINVVSSSIASVNSLLTAGKVRALAVTSKERSSVLPNVPTVAESGYKDFDFSAYYGVMAPTGLPEPVLSRLNADFNKILQQPDVRTTLLNQALEPSPTSPGEFAALIKADIQKAAEVIKHANIKVEQ